MHEGWKYTHDREEEPHEEAERQVPSETMELRAGSKCEWPITRRDFVKGASTVLGASLVIPTMAISLEATEATPHLQQLPLSLSVNGEHKSITVDTRTTLLDLLREQFHLTGTKKGCDHGQCGACTVLVNGRRINSCLALAVSYEGAELTTVEGIAKSGKLDPVQQAFLDHDGFQCGYCTPGQIVSAVALIGEVQRGDASFVTADVRKSGPVDLTDDEIRERMSGNICRCGAYPGIVAAVRQAYRVGSGDSAANAELNGGAMLPFEYRRVRDPESAITAIQSAPTSKFLAGGTNLVDLMKQNVELPTHLVDINQLELAKIEALPDGGLRLGALARNSDTAEHPLVRERYPLLAQAILAGASPQLRNLATNGGNLLQRTRCYYFYDPAYAECNKRKPGSGCAAIHGFNRIHAILGASPECIATHPSDMCVALAALGASVQVLGKSGKRTIAFADFHRLPGNTPQIDTNLRPDELIVSIDLPGGPYAEHSAYVKVRDRASYAFALVSAAAALDLDAGTIRSARLALGGVAQKPWRSQKVEDAMAGKMAGEQVYRSAADEILTGAKTYEHNSFKVAMAKETIARAFTLAASGERA